MWLALGLVLLVIELATPSGFFVMFFGLGALTVGVLDAPGPRRPGVDAVARLHGDLGRVSAALPRPSAEAHSAASRQRRHARRRDRDSRENESHPAASAGSSCVARRGTARNEGVAPASPVSAAASSASTDCKFRSSPSKEPRRSMEGGLFVIILLAIMMLIVIAKTAIVVPQQSAFVVERLGRYSGTLGAGFHILIPFMDVIRYKHSLKESAVDIPAQVCITRDNVQVQVDGVLYLKVLNPERASYGISDYLFAISQLAQTTLRSEVGKIDLDRTFEERTNINTSVVDRARQGVGAVGRQGAALRDQEHHAAARHPGGDGKADARGTGKARGDSHVRRPARRGHQHGGRHEAGNHQGVGSAPAAADQRSRRSGVGDSRGRDGHGRGAPARRRGDATCRAVSRPCSCASPSSTSTSSAR